MNDLDIRQIRQGLALTQVEFAKKLGVDTKTIQNWESGKKVPTTKHGIIRSLIDNINNKDADGEIHSPAAELDDSNSFRYYYELTATASNIDCFSDNELGQEYKRINFPGYEGCVAFNMSGESMMPTAKEKDIVVIEPKPIEVIVNGEIYLVITRDGQRIIKRLLKIRKDDEVGMVIRCISDNEDQELYAPFDIFSNDIHNIFRVVGFLSNTRVG